MKKQTFKLILPDQGHDVYMPREGQRWGYRYGPSIMVEDGVCHAWFASPGDCYEADWFTYRRSEDGGKTWTHEQVVMTPVPDSMDWFSVCDPAVIKYGEYYYMGYTSTVFANGGGVGNNGFIARSKSPKGPFERWCGNGWGETRQTSHGECHWLGKPAPVIYFDEDWKHWGAGEFSFAIKDKTIYIYYTWTSKDAQGRPMGQTRVATADITDENWPAHLTHHGVASVRASGAHDSYDVVYCEDTDTFIALSTDHRFSEESLLAVYESADGLRFERVNEIKVNTGWKLHNCGISGDPQHHIRKGDTLLLAYAYGDMWGKWGTRMHAYDFTVTDDGEDFYSEAAQENIHYAFEPWPAPESYQPTALFLYKPHFIRVKAGECAEIPLMTADVTYALRPAEGDIVFSNYDKDILNIVDGKINAKNVGYTYVDARMDELSCQFLVYVTEGEPFPTCTMMPYPEKDVVSFAPLISSYTVALSLSEQKQIRGLATYADGAWFELAGEVDKVTYESHDLDLFTVRNDGYIIPTGKAGEGSATVTCGDCSFDVTVRVIGG